jgi:hypothetical protein
MPKEVSRGFKKLPFSNVIPFYVECPVLGGQQPFGIGANCINVISNVPPSEIRT